MGPAYGNSKNTPYTLEAKADDKYECVAAASIVAKAHRDDMITFLCKQDPELSRLYGWESNMGYPTKKHIDVHANGVSEHHRLTFNPCARIVTQKKIERTPDLSSAIE